jgi:polyisoprenoid-binding protein YceI
MKTLIKTTAMALAILSSSAAMAKTEHYKIDPTHSFVQFKASHIGKSWLMGRFNEMEGELTFDDKNMANSSVKVTVNTTSLDSNHAKRDKHLMSDDYIDAGKFSTATFTSKSVKQVGDNVMINGDFTFHGMTKTLTITAQLVGAGEDPWGGYRRGYEGKATIDITDFGMRGTSGKPGSQVELNLFIEAIRK